MASSLFSRITPATTSSSPFSNALASAPPLGTFNTSASTQSGFGASAIQTQQPTSSVFGSFGNSTQNQNQNQTQNQQPTSSVFGNFASSTQNQQPTSSVFGNLGNSTQIQPSTTNGLFGQSKPSTGLFGASITQQAQQTQQQPQFNNTLNQSQGLNNSRIWSEADLQPRQKSIPEQIFTLASKWDPTTPHSPFKTYLYNSVDPKHRPFYTPGPADDEEKWEAALRSAPDASSIPVLVSGFQQLGSRITFQASVLTVLQGRLHEINSGLADLLRRHDLEIAPRAAECRRRHVRLARKVMELAAKTQVLRNRGYAMDVEEERLRVRLVELERRVIDPGLEGRSEEVWARMVVLRDRGRALEAEMERLGRVARAGAGDGESGGEEMVIDEETAKRARKILEDYDSQITHLNKELEEIRREFEDWEASRNGVNGGAR